MKQYQDQLLANSPWAEWIWDEHMRQLKKWGVQVRSAFEWLGYTTEELGELAKAISEHEYREGDKNEVVKEAIQVATLSIKIGEMFYVLEEPK